ncbi:MAG: TIR domain-containing protein, partial [Armatimonadetes bacterium]|nr:TIR domain-containing protein [Anaerolineae bacterium]
MNNHFISYSRRNKAFAEKLVAAFKAHDRDVWIDWEDIPLTADWLEEIHRGIESADDFIFIITPDSISSEVCTQELAHALAHNKRLVPLLYQEVQNYNEIHKSLSSHNWIMFNKEDEFEQSFTRLLQALDTDLEYTRSHTQLLQRTLEWEKRTRNASLLLRGQDLTEYERWLGTSANRVPHVTPLQTEYIFASRRRASRFQRILVGTLLVGFIASLLLTVVAIDSRNQAQSARDFSQTQAAIATIAQGEAEVSKDLAEARAADVHSLLLADNAQQQAAANPELAIVLALEANSVAVPPAQSQLALAEIAYEPGIKRVFPGFEGAVNGIAFSPDRAWALAGCADGSVSIWELTNGTQLFYTNDLSLPVRSVAISPNGRMIAAGYIDGSITVWQTSDYSIIQQLGGIRTQAGHTGSIQALAFTPDNQHLISGSSDNQVIQWELIRGDIVRRFNGHADDVTTLAVSPDNTLLYTGGGAEDRRIIVWDLATGRPVRQFVRHGKALLSMALSQNGQLGVSSSEEGDLIVWRTADGSVVDPLGDTFGDYKITAPITSVSFTPDSLFVVSVSRDGKLFVWDVQQDAGVTVLNSGT